MGHGGRNSGCCAGPSPCGKADWRGREDGPDCGPPAPDPLAVSDLTSWCMTGSGWIVPLAQGDRTPLEEIHEPSWWSPTDTDPVLEPRPGTAMWPEVDNLHAQSSALEWGVQEP